MIRTRVALSGVTTGAAVSTMYWLGTDDSTAATAIRNGLQEFWSDWAARAPAVATATLDPAFDIVDPASGNITGLLSATGFTVTGAGGGEQLAKATQGLLQWRTGVYLTGGTTRPTTKELRGRTFLPGPQLTDSDNGKPGTDYVTAINTAAGDLVALTVAELAVYSRAHGVAHPVTLGSVWPEWAVLRSRRD